MQSDFAAARRHLEQAQDCLRGDDNVTDKMLTALSLLIDAALTAEYRRTPPGEVVPFPRIGADRLNPRPTAKRTFGNRGEGPPS